ncbi:MAG: hypothetical protein E7294_01280 [Lachnospiraceae bacterium]|nr:hypothetical protein [Lachnospiraceae bacterium]
MEKDKLSTEEIIKRYKPDTEKLMRYLPYFDGKRSNEVSYLYKESGGGANGIAFPVYEPTLLSFINEAKNTVFVDRNYRYIYSRNSIRTHKDEWHMIETAAITDMDILGGILSKYVLEGMTKGRIWVEAVEYEIFYRVIDKARELILFWDKEMGGK